MKTRDLKLRLASTRYEIRIKLSEPPPTRAEIARALGVSARELDDPFYTGESTYVVYHYHPRRRAKPNA